MEITLEIRKLLYDNRALFDVDASTVYKTGRYPDNNCIVVNRINDLQISTDSIEHPIQVWVQQDYPNESVAVLPGDVRISNVCCKIREIVQANSQAREFRVSPLFFDNNGKYIRTISFVATYVDGGA